MYCFASLTAERIDTSADTTGGRSALAFQLPGDTVTFPDYATTRASMSSQIACSSSVCTS